MRFIVRIFIAFSPEIEFLPSLNHTYGKATLTRFEFDFRRVLTVVNFLWIEVVLEEALFCQAFILSSRSTVVVVGVE